MATNLKIFTYGSNNPSIASITESSNGNIEIRIKAVDQLSYDMPNEDACNYIWNFNPKELLKSKDQCPNKAGVFDLVGFSTKDIVKGTPIVTPPLVNRLKTYYQSNFKRLESNDFFGSIDINPKHTNISLRMQANCKIISNLSYDTFDYVKDNGYTQALGTSILITPPSNKHQGNTTPVPQDVYPFTLSYSGPTQIPLSGGIFNISFDFDNHGIKGKGGKNKNPGKKPGQEYHDLCDYNVVYANADKGKIDPSCKIINKKGSISFDPTGLSVGDTVTVDIGVHWFLLSIRIQFQII